MRTKAFMEYPPPYDLPHNAAVQRPRDHVSSAARVHNEMTRTRRARDAV
jgi:hypothetical protein